MVVEVAKKGRTIRQGPLVQLGCSLAGINREAFEAVGTWGRVGKLLKKRRCKDRWKRKKKDTRQKKLAKKSSIRFPEKMKYNSCTKDMKLHVLVITVLQLNNSIE